jgi:type VI secretion system secreted protein Hcp
MPIFLKYGAIKGDSTSKGHEDWIILHSLQWGAGRGISSSQGSSENRTASGASISEVTVTKILDPASTELLQDMLKGGLATTAQIDLTETKENTAYFSIIMTNTGISGISLSTGGDRPSESMSFNFTKLAITNTKKDATGKATPTTITYDSGLESLV